MDKQPNALLTFEWEGLSSTGKKITGEMQARSLAIAKAELYKQGIITRTIKKKRIPFWKRQFKKLNQGDITLFSRQMATMIEAGIPIIQSFDIVSKSTSNVRLRNLIETIKKDVETGLTFCEALKRHPEYFNDLFCNLIDAGEKSGSLETMLENIAIYKEKTESIKKKIKKALTYPTAVLVVACLVTGVLLMFVVPQFQALFAGFGADLPALTRTVINMSAFLQSYWYIVGAIVGGGIYALVYFKRHSLQFAQALDRFSLKLPIVGTVLRKAAIARFSRTLSITFAAGLPLVDALKSVAGATGNILYEKATDKIREDISTGQSLRIAMETTHLFPSMVTQMVTIGEESGTLERMLSKVADFYEEEVDNAVDALSSLLEPMIMSILGVLVGGLVVAMYLPIFKLGSVI